MEINRAVDLEQTDLEWRIMAMRSLFYAKELIHQGHTRFFVSGDEPATVKGYKNMIITMGGSIVEPDESLALVQRTLLAALRVLRGDNIVDVMRFAACGRVLQVVKYSSYSTAAALIGHIPLVNFFGNTSHVRLYQDLLPSLIYYLPDVDVEKLKNTSLVGEIFQAESAAGCTADNVFCRHTQAVKG